MDNHGFSPDEPNGKPPFAIGRYPAYPNNGSNYLVEVNTRATLLKKPLFYKRISCVLLVIALLCFIGFVACLALYIGGRTTICTSDECIRTASNLKYSMDFSVDPCDNFYQYTCGNWEKEHPNHGWYYGFSSINVIVERNEIDIMNFLRSKPKDDEPKAINMTRAFYESCMDQDAIDDLGLSVVYKYLEKAELPIVPAIFTKPSTEHQNFKFDWIKYDVMAKRYLAMDIFVGFIIGRNVFNGTQNVIWVGTPDTESPLPSPFQKKHKIKQSDLRSSIIKREDGDSSGSEQESKEVFDAVKRNIFKYVVGKIISNNSAEQPSEALLDEAATAVLNISDNIAGLKKKFDSQNDDEALKVNLTFLQNQINNLTSKEDFDINNFWSNYFSVLFNDTKITVHQDTLILSTELEVQYFPKMLTFLLETTPIYLELYVWYVVVYAMIINTSSDIVQPIIKETESVYEGELTKPRPIACATLTTKYLGMAVSYAMVESDFDTKVKPKVEKMIGDIKEAFVYRLNSVNWMDSKIKARTVNKSKEMISFIGYPDWFKENGSIDDYYKELELKPDSYLDNLMQIANKVHRDVMASFEGIVKRDWSCDPIETNAFNSFPDNAIDVPMGILKYPLYNLGLEILNYGSFGSVIGHELTHGFDNNGRKFNEVGNREDWWDNDTSKAFEQKTKCFVDHFNNLTYAGADGHVDGNKTLGENIADNGGLHQAFVAYENHVKRHGREPYLPGFENFTDHQLFFIAYASIWCETVNVAHIEYQFENDEHSPSPLRVIGTLQNMPEFAKAFNCPKGSYMNMDKEKCQIW